MQTTLLGLCIAVIVALVAALVGPRFVDWGNYRAPIEAEASRIIGAPVHVSGKIDVRLLPTPSLALHGVEVGTRGGNGPKLAARTLAMEFALGPLMRGQFRAADVAVDGLDAAVGLDRVGNLDIPTASLAFDPDRLAIDHLTVEGGHVALADVASGGRLSLDNVKFAGELRSLVGPFKADGSFTAKDEPYNFRVAGSRRGEDGDMKLRLAVDSAVRALAFESDGTLWTAAPPRYEGTISLARIVGAALPDGRVAINEPWKVVGKLKATAANAQLEQLEISYGAEPRAFHWAGATSMEFGAKPRLAGQLAARQFDLDRALGAPGQKRLPFETVKVLTDGLTAWPIPSMPAHVTLSVDSLMLGGGILTGVRGEIDHDANGWTVDALDLRAPGATMSHIAGKLGLSGDKVAAFTGPIKLDSNDPALLLAWIEGQGAAGRPTLGPMRASGTVTLGGARVAVDGLDAEVDRKPLHGALAYRFASGAAPARLDATLAAADIDLDRSVAVGKALFASTSFERPGEMTLALDIGRANYEGIEASKINAALSYDSSGLKIERLAIADIGGANLDASGRIDSAGDMLRGSVALSLAASRLDGVATLADKFAPRAADLMRRYSGRAVPLRVNAKVDVAPGPKTGAKTTARIKLDGKLAGMEVSLDGAGGGDVSDPGAAVLRIDGHLDAADARVLATLTGLDALVVADARPARLTFSADGAFNRSFRVDGKLAGGDLNASASGTLTPDGDATLDVALHAPDTRLPRRDGSGSLPVDLRGKVAVADDAVSLTELAGRVGGSTVKGKLALGLAQPLWVDGRIETDRVDVADLIALFTGAPRPSGNARPAEWPTEPFGEPPLPEMTGRVEFRVASAQWTAGLTTRDLAGAVSFDGSGFSLAGVTGRLADGQLNLAAQVRRAGNEISLQTHVALANADIPALLGSTLRVPAAGRIWLDTQVQGQGLSPGSLIGALNGSGTVTINHAEVASLDPAAIDAVIVALERDRNLAGSPTRVADIAGGALELGKLKLPFAAAAIMIANGRAQAELTAPAQNADLSGSIALGIADGQIDARLVMTGPAHANAPAGQPPALGFALRGPIASARRSLDVASLIEWVTARSLAQDAKILDDVQQERKRIEATADALRRQDDVAVPSATGSTAGPAVTVPLPPTPPTPSAPAATQARNPGLAPPGEFKPVPPAPVRRAPPPQPKPSNLLDLFTGNH